MKAHGGPAIAFNCQVFAALLAAAISMITTAVTATDWPCFRGANGDGHTEEKVTIWPPQELWRANVGWGFSQVVVNQGKAYTMGCSNNQNYIWCFSENSTGANPTPLWVTNYFCYNGRGDWPGVYPTPAVSEGKVYTSDNYGLLNCFDANTGAFLWSNTAFRAGGPDYCGSPIVEGDLVIVNSGSHGTGVGAISKTTHNVVWGTCDTAGSRYASPFATTIGGQRTIISYGQNVSGIDPVNGNVLWYFPFYYVVSDGGIASPLIIDSNKLFVSQGYGTGCAMVNLGSTGLLTKVWRNVELSTKENGPVSYGGYVYGVNEIMNGATDYTPNSLRCIDPLTGTLMWKSSDSNALFGTESGVASCGDQIVVVSGRANSSAGYGVGGFSGNGDLVVARANPTNYLELYRATNLLVGCTWTQPTLCNGNLYLRGEDGQLLCLKVGNPIAVTGIVQFATSAYSVPENGGAVIVSVVMPNGASGPVTVDFTTGGGTGVAGVNYVATNGTLNYAYGETSKTFTVSVMDDGIWSPGNLTVNLGLSHITGSAVFGSPTSAALTILDVDGTGCFQFSSSGYAVSQDAGTMLITVTRANGHTGAANVNYATSDGTAQNVVNYAATSGTLNFANNETSKTFSVTILNSPVGGSGKTVNLTLSNPTGGATVGTPGTAVLTIVPPGPFSTWSHCMKIQFPGYTRAEPLTNFPVSLVFSNNMGGGFAYGQLTSPAGGDLRFADSSKSTALNFEIEKWATNGASYVWVQVPVLATNCSIWALWGSSTTNLPACTINGSTWNPDFRGVWHLGEVNGTAKHFDFTANANDATTNGTTTMSAAGVVDGAAAYTGADIGRITNVNSSLTITGKMLTVGIWLEPTATLNQTAKTGFLGKFQESGGNGSDYGLFYDWTSVHVAGGGTDFSAGYDPPLNSWTYLVGVYDGSYLRLYVNGVQFNSTTCSGNTPNNYSALIGGGYWGGRFNGKLDEGRIMAAAASANWIWASYMNMASNSVFCSFTNDASGTAAMGTPISWLTNHGLTGDPSAQELGDPDGDGVPTWQEYIMGTDPTSGSSALKATIQHSAGSGLCVSFSSLCASGSDYSGKSRSYTLEFTPSLISPSWQAVTGCSNLPGSDSIDVYTNANPTLQSLFYRIKCRLQ